jgi:hypothetical protein
VRELIIKRKSEKVEVWTPIITLNNFGIFLTIKLKFADRKRDFSKKKKIKKKERDYDNL